MRDQSIFRYQGQEEDHYTNILMNLLSKNQTVLESFIRILLPIYSGDFSFNQTFIQTRKKSCPQGSKPYEYVIGISPYERAINNRNPYEDNRGSIPDAWICGDNFNLLFEFKIRGVLDESQLAAHEKLLGTDSMVIRLQWNHVIRALEGVSVQDPVIQFLVEEFIKVTENFKSKRNSSGMPKQIISNRKANHETYFIITGSKKTKRYMVELVQDGQKRTLNHQLDGIQAARSWIANIVFQHKDELSIPYEGMYTVINDYCVVPGRKKNQWNQWRIGGFLDR